MKDTEKSPKSPPKYDHAENSPGFLLWQLAHLWQRQVVAELRPLGLTHVQFVLLSGLKHLQSNRNTPVTQAQLADYSRTDIMMTSKVVRKLEDKELIARENHPQDTRAKSIRLTKDGEKCLKKAVGIVDKLDQKFFATAGLSAQQFADLLQGAQVANISNE